MRLIADSGSTKTDWVLTDKGQIVGAWKTQGINPYHQQPEEIRQVLCTELIPSLGDKLQSDLQLSFYGSGCTADLIPTMTSLLAESFQLSADNVEVAGDLLAAARAVCGHGEGIACILGTGANSCLYDGQRIVQNTPPLGYILGDEGSGAVLGARFLNGIFKGSLPASLRDSYLEETGQSYADVIRRVYREPLANRYLASVALFVCRHLEEECLKKLVKDNFSDFILRNIEPYHSRLPIGFVGSVAYGFAELLTEVCHDFGYEVSWIDKSPITGLLERYYGDEHSIL